MNKPTEDLYQAIIALEGNKFFEEIVKWIKDSKEDLNNLLICASGEQTIKLQGSVSELSDIIFTIKDARDSYNIIQEGKKNRKPHY